VAALINKTSQGSGEGQAQAKARQQKNCDGRRKPGRFPEDAKPLAEQLGLP
jgi:hypothetical protein